MIRGGYPRMFAKAKRQPRKQQGGILLQATPPTVVPSFHAWRQDASVSGTRLHHYSGRPQTAVNRPRRGKNSLVTGRETSSAPLVTRRDGTLLSLPGPYCNMVTRPHNF
jgi:hypothetical protein